MLAAPSNIESGKNGQKSEFDISRNIEFDLGLISDSILDGPVNHLISTYLRVNHITSGLDDYRII